MSEYELMKLTIGHLSIFILEESLIAVFAPFSKWYIKYCTVSNTPERPRKNLNFLKQVHIKFV